MEPEKLYVNWLEAHCTTSRGERLRRLQQVKIQGYAEKLFWLNAWWPAMGSVENLHPEYEVADFKDGSRYLDYAYIQGDFRACFEIDGFGPHWKDMGRAAFSDERMRQNHLIIDG